MTEMTLAQALDEARKFNAFVRAFAKLSEVMESAVASEQIIAAAKVEADKECAAVLKTTEAARSELAVVQADIEKGKASLEDAQAQTAAAAKQAQAIIDDAKVKAKAVADAARAQADKVGEEAKAVAAEIARQNSVLESVKGEVVKAKAERDAINADIEAIKRQARALAG